MKNVLNIIITTLTATLFSSIVFAHPGHDHGEITVNYLQVLWFIPALLGGGVVAYKTAKSIKKQYAQSSKKD